MEVDPIAFQVNVFKDLVAEVNHIPGVAVSLTVVEDRQRDSLALVVDASYRQFQGSNWRLVLSDLPKKVREWNTPPNSAASLKVLELVRHMYEYRVISLSEDPSLSDADKAKARAVFGFFSSIVDSLLKNPPKDRPVSFAGVSITLLPQWYLDKLYS